MQATSETSALTSGSHSPRHRRRNKKARDPFLELSADNDDFANIMPSMTPEHKGEDAGSNSLFTDLVLAPLSMISFLLSLFLVDRQQRQWRLSQHAANPETFWYRLSHWSWHGPQPYQNFSDSTWGRSDNAMAHNVSSEQWYARKKHRAVAKLEISDAFEMRKRVIFALAAWTIIGLYMLYYASMGLYQWAFRR